MSQGQQSPMNANRSRSSTLQNILKPWVYEPLGKSKALCERMLRLHCLVALYKCMENNCAFATSSAKKMAEHIRRHPMDRFLPCAYCSDWFHSGAMISHVYEEHGLSKFQCRHCFFRAFDACCVLVHQEYYHPEAGDEDILDILTNEADTRRMEFKNDVRLKFATAPKSLECTDCNHKLLTFPAYLEHINHIEGPMIRCQFCSQSVNKKQIFRHLLIHDIGIFECIYCNHAVTDIAEIKLHLIHNHPSNPMYYISRLRANRTPENVENKTNMLRMMAVDVPVKKVYFTEEEMQEANLSFDMKIFDRPENARIEVKREKTESLESIPLDESIKPLATVASTETSEVAAPCLSRPKKEPMLPVIVKVQGGVKFSETGDIIGDSESITTQSQKKHMVSTSTSIKPVEANPPLPIALIPSKLMNNTEDLYVGTRTSVVQRATDSTTIEAPMNHAVRVSQLSHVKKMVKISLPITSAKAVALAQFSKIPELSVSISAIDACPTKEKITQIADRNDDNCKANVSEMNRVPSQRVGAANVKLPKVDVVTERSTCVGTIPAKPCDPPLKNSKAEASTTSLTSGTGGISTIATQKKSNVQVKFLLHECSHLIEEFQLALESMVAKTEIDGSVGLKTDHRCYCCLICYHCTYDMLKLGKHFNFQHCIFDVTVSLIHPDHDSLQSSIVLMLPTGMPVESKLHKMEKLIRAEMREVQPCLQQEKDRLMIHPEQQNAETLVGNDTAKIRCYPSSRPNVKRLSELCSVGRDELAKKHPDYQNHLWTCGPKQNTLFTCFHCGRSVNCAESVASVFSHLNSHQEFLFDTIETLAYQTAALKNNINGEPCGMGTTELDGRYFVCFLCCYSNTEFSKTAQHVVSEHHFQSKLEFCFVRPKLKHQQKRLLLVYPISLCGPMKLARIRELINFQICNANNAVYNSTPVSPRPKSGSIAFTLETTIPANVVDKANCGQLYKCGFCLDQTSKSRLQLLIHLDTDCMFKGINYPCAHCDEMLDCRAAKSNEFNADIIFEHLYYHGENLYRCSVCGFMHYKRMIIKKHLSREHHQHDGVVVVRESSVWWDCSLCDLRTRYRQTIMEHMMKKHNLPGERYMCGHCRDSDYNTQYFKAHMAISHPEVPAEKLQIIEMYTSVPVENEDANTSGTTDTSVFTGSNQVDAPLSLKEPIEATSTSSGSRKSFSTHSQNDRSKEKSISRMEKSENFKQECDASPSPSSITNLVVVQQSASATTTNESQDRSLPNLLKAAPLAAQESSSLGSADNPKIEDTNVVQDTEIALQVDKEDIGILKSILPVGTPLTRTKFGVKLRLESPTPESKSEKLKPLPENSGMANDFILKDIKEEETMEQSPRPDNAMEISSPKQTLPRATSRRSARVAMQQDGTQQWSNSTVLACYFCKEQYQCLDSLKCHTRAKHAEQELLRFVAVSDNLKCVFQLIPLLRCFYCMGSTVGTYDQLLEHCKQEHTGKIFVCVDFWNVLKCGFCPYLNGSGIQKEIQDHFVAIHNSDATTANSTDHVDSDFLAWALEFGTIQPSDGSVKKAEVVRYVCNRCGAHADSEESLGEHMAYHLFHFACRHCPFTVKELKVLYEHSSIMHAQTDVIVPGTFNTVPHYEYLFETLAMFSNGFILSKRELLTTKFLSYMRKLNKGIQTSYRRQLADLEQYKRDLQLPLETPSGYDSEGDTCATFIKKQFFYPALIIPQMNTAEAEYANELPAQVKSEDAKTLLETECSNVKRMRRTSRL